MTERNLLVLLQKLKKQNLDEKYAKYLDTYVYKKREDQDLMAPCKNCKPIESVIEPEPTESFKNQRSSTEVRSKPPYSTIMPKEHANLLPCIELSKLPHEEVHTLRLTIKNALDFNKEEVLGSGCFDYLCNKKLKYILGSALSITNLTIPTRRLPLYTDFMYMSEAQFKLTLELFKNLCRKIGHDENSESENNAIDEVLGCREIIILCMFLEFEIKLYGIGRKIETEDQDPDFIRNTMIIEGYAFFLRQCHDYGIEKAAERIHTYGSDLNCDQTRVASVFACDRREISTILKIMYMNEYKSKFVENSRQIRDLFEFHPIFAQMTTGFYLYKQGFGIKENDKEKKLLRRQAALCGIFLRNCYQTNTELSDKNVVDAPDFNLSPDDLTILKAGIDFYGIAEDCLHYQQIFNVVYPEVKLLLRDSSNEFASVPTNKHPLFTDIIHMSKSDLKCTLKLYFHYLTTELDTNSSSEIIKQLFKTRLLVIIGLYMGKQAQLNELSRKMDKEKHTYKRITIMQGFKHFFKLFKELGLWDLADFLIENGSRFVTTDLTKQELLHMFIKTLEKYRIWCEKDGKNEFYNDICDHPIFTQLTANFYLMKQGAVLINTKYEHITLQMLQERISNCGLHITECEVTVTLEKIKRRTLAIPKTHPIKMDSLVADLTADQLEYIEEVICSGLNFYKNPFVRLGVCSLVEHLLRGEESDLPEMPVDRSPVITDLVYMSKYLFETTLTRYFALVEQLYTVHANLIVKKMLKNRELIIVGLYMGAIATYTQRSFQLDAFYIEYQRLCTIKGYEHFLERIEEFEGCFPKMANYFIEYGPFMAGDIAEHIMPSNELELIHIFRAIGKYKEMFVESKRDFIRCFELHPIYFDITNALYLIKRGIDNALPAF